MIALVLVVAAGACLCAGWLLGAISFVYAALILSGTGIVLVVWPVLRRSVLSQRASTDEEIEENGLASEHEHRDSIDSVSNIGQVAEPVDDHNSIVEDAVEVLINQETGSHLESESRVYVRDGRKRFHVDSCRLMDMAHGEELTLVEAREESFTPCSVCIRVDSPELSSQ